MTFKLIVQKKYLTKKIDKAKVTLSIYNFMS